MNDARKSLVLDANILIRAVLGKKVRGLIDQYAGAVRFYTAEVCYEDALKYIPPLMERRNLPVEKPLAILDALLDFISVVDSSLYSAFEAEARKRIGDGI